MKSSVIVLIVGLFFVLSCTRRISHDEHVSNFSFSLEDFGEERKLKGQEFPLENLFYPAFIEVIPEKNLLIVMEIGGDFLGKVYTLDSLKFVKSFIKRGDGPNEQLNVSAVGYLRETGQLYVTDVSTRKLYFYQIDSLRDLNNSSMPSHIVDFNNREVIKASVIDSAKIVDFYPSYYDDSVAVLNFFSQSGEVLFKGGGYPPTRRKYAPHELITVFSSGLSVSYDRDKVILNYYYTDYIDVFDSSGNLTKRIKGPDNFDPSFRSITRDEKKGVVLRKDGRRGYTGNARMKDELLVLYNGKMISDQNYHTDKLLSFDDQFMPAILYELDKEIFAFDIDWDERILYGISHNGENNLIKFTF